MSATAIPIEDASPPRARRADWDALSLRVAFGILAAIALVFLVAPTIIVLLTSFTASESLKFPPAGYSLRWYRALLDADQMQAAAWNSLIVAFWTMVASVHSRHRRGARHRRQPNALCAHRRRAVHVAVDPAGARVRVRGARLHPSARIPPVDSAAIRLR